MGSESPVLPPFPVTEVTSSHQGQECTHHLLGQGTLHSLREPTTGGRGRCCPTWGWPCSLVAKRESCAVAQTEFLPVLQPGVPKLLRKGQVVNGLGFAGHMQFLPYSPPPPPFPSCIHNPCGYGNPTQLSHGCWLRCANPAKPF